MLVCSTKSHPDSFPFLERKPEGWPQSALGRLTASAQTSIAHDTKGAASATRRSGRQVNSIRPFPDDAGRVICNTVSISNMWEYDRGRVCWHQDCASAIRCCAEGRGLWTRAAVLVSGQHQSTLGLHAAKNVDD
ncbi:unnamed protein product [Periconia digitata]|uniref:Uncharacterized protein n=1 Tax=Periconia digitata TaxID=1303443 RepID=A0A9W4UTK8_9PLEO|nr:unnamed protein product [Periconia digitata]